MDTTSESFYEELGGFHDFSVFSNISNYQPLPADWMVIITDVKGSTQAINAGHYKSVNAIGAASIVAILNAVKPVKIPYVFGGDGATFCIPPGKKDVVEPALLGAMHMAQTQFNLDLRIGMVPMSHIMKNHQQVLVGKYQPSPYFHQAMFAGNGLSYAEKLVKDPASSNKFQIDSAVSTDTCNFDGFECRWNEIPSPSEETVSILVQVLDKDDQIKAEIYNDVFQKIVDIYGHENRHHPIRENDLRLTLSPRKLSIEAQIRTTGKPAWKRWLYIVKILLLDIAGSYMMKNKVTTSSVEWDDYKSMLITNTDFRKFDELLRMVISGTRRQQKQLRQFLQQMHDDKKIAYGIHAAPSALMTCLVFNHQNEHIHFLDSSNGGYAMAANELKQQIKSMID